MCDFHRFRREVPRFEVHWPVHVDDVEPEKAVADGLIPASLMPARASARRPSRAANIPRKGVTTRIPTYGIAGLSSTRAGSTISIRTTVYDRTGLSKAEGHESNDSISMLVI